MTSILPSKSQEIRGNLSHPVIDADGHNLELNPALLDYVNAIGGKNIRDAFEERLKFSDRNHWVALSDEDRRYNWITAPAWWGMPAKNTLDRATASLPKLLHQRMDELGLDYAIIYPTWRPGLMRFQDEQHEEIRRVSCRALNTYHADIYKEYSDRMTPAAMIPMLTPQEAIDELTYSIQTLGLKVPAIASLVRRPIPKLEAEAPDVAYTVHRLDPLALDSDYDYDPFWDKCIELKVAPACHASTFEWEAHGSISNYVYNHIGSFAKAGEAFCKALFMGGVTKRFPTLNIAFLEGGVSWACALYAGLISHWEKRNKKDIWNLDPNSIDSEMMLKLIDTYGHQSIRSQIDEIRKQLATGNPTPRMVDDWSKVPMESVQDIKTLFVEPFYFGCEADDPMNSFAFNTKVNPLGAKLKAVFSSDIGHWDVPDMREVVEEAYELVEHELITEEDFKDFVCTNVIHLYGDMNPDFFVGTAVEDAARKVLSSA